MKKSLHTFILLILISLLPSCANFKLQYDSDNADWKTKAIEKPTGKLEHTLFLIGDAGYTADGITPSPALALLQKKLAQANENSHVVFLGDNIYPYGMPPKSDDADRVRAENRLDAQLNILKDFKGHPIFLPGNHDWIRHGLKGVRRQEKYIEKHLNAGIEDDDDWKNYFLPDNGCGGPEIVEVNKNLAYIIVDSNWYLRDWDKDAAINDGCDAKNRRVFDFLFEESLRKNRNKNVVVLMHHPLNSYGPHGGKYAAKMHLFPLTELNKNLYIPLPGLGTLAALGRGTIGSRQDLAHPGYRAMKKSMLLGAGKNGRFIFAAGHEHNLQYIETDRNQFIVSGAGSKKNPAKLGKGAQFVYGGQGFSKLEFYENGTTWLEFWRSVKGNENGELVYRKKIRDKLEKYDREQITDFPEYDQKKDSVNTLLLTRRVKKGSKFRNAFLGKHHRETYVTPFNFETLDLSTHAGGLTPIKRGGGGQTNSVRLQDSQGRHYTMRDMTKDASRLIPYPFNQMDLAGSIVEDTYLATYPFAPLVIPKMADAAKVYHTNPKLFYIPKQPTLGEYNDVYGGAVYLFEERPVTAWKDNPSFGNPIKILNTDKLVSKITKNNHHKVDQAWALRSRMFDIMIGDFDRHDDQWRWALIKDEDGEKLYRPIPRDRDQPFAKYDGFLTIIANNFVPFLRLLKPYKANVGNIKWTTYNGRIFDKSFIGEMDWEDWERETKYIQDNVTDEVIDEAFKNMPVEAQRLAGNDIKEIVKQRRDNMMEIAKKYYTFLAKEVDIYGTDKKELFEIVRMENGDVDVKVYDSNKKGDKQKLVYHRLFLKSQTKELNIYGLGDDDIFNITGGGNKGIFIRTIGCLGNDTFNDSSKVGGFGKKTWVYDTPEGNTLNLGTEAKNKTSNHRDNNIYDRENIHYEYDFLMPLPIIGSNPDDGFLFGAFANWVRYGYKKFPYSQHHHLSITAAASKVSLDVIYQGEFIRTVGNMDFTIDSRFYGDRFAYNFFGLGNETTNDVKGLSYNRVQNSLIYFNPNLRKLITRGNGEFLIGGTLRRIGIENNADDDPRFINEFALDNPNIFDSKLQLGAKVAFNYANLDNPLITHSGTKFQSSLSWENDIWGNDVNVGKLKASLAFYYSLDKNQYITLATQVGTQHNFGKFNFYDGAIIGGTINGTPSTLRGFRAERFTGNTSLYHNSEVRIKLFSSTNRILPFTIGVHGGFDYGRVWVDDEDSDKWHQGYGGGVWFSPVNALLFRGEYFVSDEEKLITIGAGFAF
ncbi:MAG: BamA/TamA family outer membrane protein [Saprospiraceae bacterium]